MLFASKPTASRLATGALFFPGIHAQAHCGCSAGLLDERLLAGDAGSSNFVHF